jgi:hypothetical protein
MLTGLVFEEDVSVANVVATPHQLAVVTQVLDAYCIAFAVSDVEARERIAALLLQFLERGKTSIDDLSSALEEHILNGFLR